MGSALELARSFRRREASHRRDESPVLPERVAWVIGVATIVSRSALSTMVALLLWGLLPNLVGFQTTVVMSGSMAPQLAVGDTVIVRPVDAAQMTPGRILLFDDPDEPGRLRMHRLVEMRSDGRLVTKGDANPTVDSSTIAIGAVRGAGFLRVPFAGLPSYWYRTGQILPLVSTAALVVVLVGGVRLGRLLEEPAARERRRHRGVRLRGAHRAVAAGAVLVVLGAGSTIGPGSAQAVYSATVRPAASTWSSPCGELAPAGTGVTPRFSWSYGVGSGSSVADQSGNANPGVLAGDWSRSTCTGGASPFITVGSASAGGVIETKSSQLPGDMTVATWFKTTTRGGVIADFGNSNTSATSGTLDRALYIRADGNITFGARTVNVVNLVSTPMYCTTTSPSTNGFADGSWHLVVATFGYSSGCTLTVDDGTSAGSSASQAPSVSLVALSTFTGYWRFGYDAVSSTVWTGATTQQAFSGSLDETQAYDAILSSTARGKIWTRSH